MIRRTGLCLLAFGMTALGARGTGADTPLRFEPHTGPAQAEGSFFCRAAGHTVYLTPGTARFQADGSEVQMTLAGANPSAEAVGIDPLGGLTNYLIGADRTKWRTGAPAFARVEFRDIYPGINVVYSSTEGRLEYAFVLTPGADPSQIRIRFDGAEEVRLDPKGDLILRTAHGEFRHTDTQVFQTRKDGRRRVPARLALRGSDEVVFDLERYDRGLPLLIDPTILYSTYMGGSGRDAATSIALDAAGNSYVAGWTETIDFWGIVNPAVGLGRSVSAYIAKFNSTGSLVYITYFGGSGEDRAFGIGVDSSGSAVVTGWTYSPDFPLFNAAQARFGGGRDGFLLKLTAAGNALVFSTYIGGSGYDSGNAVALDSHGDIYVAGETASVDLPVLNAVQKQNGGGQDAFVVKFSGAGVRQYATYIGGVYDDRAAGVAVDASLNAYIAGSTYSPNFPVVNALQSKLGGGQDAFVTKLNSTGSALLYSTYIGGSGGTPGSPEGGVAIAVDSGGCAYVAGDTSSPNFPMSNPLQSHLAGSADAFVTKLSADGKALAYSTYLGGYSVDFATAIVVGSSGAAYVGGYTISTDFPVVNGVQNLNGGSYDIFVAKLAAAGNSLQMSTYFGGNASDAANAVAVDAGGNIYLAGQTQSTDFPSANAVQVYKTGAMSAFAAKISLQALQPPVNVSVTPSSGSGQSQTFMASFSDSGGYQDIQQVQFMVDASLNPIWSCFARWDQGAGFYLLNDGASIWMGPIAPGSSASLQNSQCLLSGATSAVSGSNNTLNVSFGLTFLNGMRGTKSVYMLAVGAAGNSSWQSKGSWTTGVALAPPVNVSVSPSSGSGQSQTFTATFSDSGGYQDIRQVQFIMNGAISAVSSCFARWDQGTGFYLLNDAATVWMGPVIPGSSAMLQNTQCALNAAASAVNGSGDTLNVVFGLTFLGGMTGTQNVYMLAVGSAGNSGWKTAGTWSATSAVQPPVNVSVSPKSGSGPSQAFTATFSDSGGYQDIRQVQFMVNATVSPISSCFARWDRGVGFYLLNDAATVWMGPITPGSSAMAQNSQCILGGATSSVTGSGNALNVGFGLTFRGGLTGKQNVYMLAVGSAGNSGWQAAGTWTVP